MYPTNIDERKRPVKSRMVDYLSEMNRPYERENDTFQPPLARMTSSFSQCTMAQSSSSTETSPESFPDLTQHQFPPEEARRPRLYQRHPQWKQEQYDNQYRHDHYNSFRAESIANREHFEGHTRPFESHMHSEFPNRCQRPDMSDLVLAEHIYETPPIMRRQRPIIGRKIMATTDALPKTVDELPIWQPDMLHTPPKSLECKYTPSTYELFPPENQSFEFPSPVKTPHTSPQYRTSSRISLSPKTTRSVTPPPQSPFSPRMQTPFKEPLIGPSVSFTSYGSSKMCTFCRKNGETPVVYMTHTVKEKVGNRNVVTCPILRSHVCSTCGASGDNAHTITYCPVLRSGNNGQPLQSTTITLKNTRVKSNGRRRY